MDFDTVRQFERLRHAAPIRAEQSCRVCLVEHQPCAITLLQFHNLPQRREVAVHREHAFGDDKNAARIFSTAPFEDVLQFACVIVREHSQRRARQPGTIDDARVHELIDDDDVVFLQQGANGSQSRRVTG